MSTQGGLKHAATESHLDTKRERGRRGAAGRAAALRRAPSDSDCSGETASLSADSADRVRPALPPPLPTRQSKTRSRRRGSEWEVLEGLKDGQRFERRPDVFNGYLHKKRKWPLKGWHKRFFVVDGGILVYARSPTDVARGRLHGSVDVGLSVISAKARRRRIDIDADEFIYHLRAKTPDVFRTWLNVLKAHRLYRQHLLTFGARESVPKIHAPLDDLPPDNSSPSSYSSLLTSSSAAAEYDFLKLIKLPELTSTPETSFYLPYNDAVSHRNPVYDWHEEDLDDNELIPLHFETLEEKESFVAPPARNIIYNHSLCSMNCVAKCNGSKLTNLANGSMRMTDDEKQMLSAELEANSLLINPFIESSFNNNTFNSSINNKNLDKPSKSPAFSNKLITPKCGYEDIKQEIPANKPKSAFLKTNTTATYFLFANKTNPPKPPSPVSTMKRSKKSTNLVRYRNVSDEPPLQKPLSKSMLLRRGRNRLCKRSGDESRISQTSKLSDDIQAAINLVPTQDQSLQDMMTASEYDKIAERLVMSIFDTYRKETPNSGAHDIQYYVNKMVQELYDFKLSRRDVHPVKVLFKCLLEYWLKNTSANNMKNALRCVKSVNTQSYFATEDKNMSSLFIGSVTKETQMLSEQQIVETLTPNSPKPVVDINVVSVPDRTRETTYSSLKERRIQELERLLKNTIYTFETASISNHSKEKDIEITKKLINNLENFSMVNRKKSSSQESRNNSSTKSEYVTTGKNKENSNSSTEFPKIQETFNHLISETAIPPSVAKEFLGAYLDVLLNDTANNNSTPTQSSNDSKGSQEVPVTLTPACDVQTESVLKRMSVGVITANEELIKETYKTTDTKESKINGADKTAKTKCQLVDTAQDPGQMYLKDVLDKITTLFSKVHKQTNKTTQDNILQPDDTKVEGSLKSKVKKNEYLDKKLISDNIEENCVVIDLTKYDLEQISMFSEPLTLGKMTITIKLKERSPEFRETKHKNLNLKFSEDAPKPITHVKAGKSVSKSYLKSKLDQKISFKNPYFDYDPALFNEKINLKPYFCSSEATSKAYKVMYESEHSIDLSLHNDSKRSFDCRDDAQSCYVLSTVKKSTLSSVFQSKKKCRQKENAGGTVVLREPCTTSKRPKLAAFEKPAPRVIDEKFILLLLENLTQLSKTLPGLNKEISGLYSKLKKKYEKDLRNTGVGLLGRIYNESKVTGDIETQYDLRVLPEKPIKIKSYTEMGINTEKICNIYVTMNRSAGAICLAAIKNTDVQTDEKPPEKKIKKMIDFSNCTLSDDIVVMKRPYLQSRETYVTSEIHMKNPSEAKTTSVIAEIVPSSNSFKKVATKDCAICTIINSILNNDSCANFRFVRNDEEMPRQAVICVQTTVLTNDGSCHDIRHTSDDKQNQKKQELDTDMKPLVENKDISDKQQSRPVSKKRSSSNEMRRSRASNDVTQEMTFTEINRKLQKFLEHKMDKDFNVYALFRSSGYNPNQSSSFIGSNIDGNCEILSIYRGNSDPSLGSGLTSPAGPLRAQAGFVSGTPGGRLATWIVESGGPLENASRELGQAQLSVQQLQRLLDSLELLHHHDTDQVSLEGASPNVKKDRRKFGLRKKKSNSKCASVELAPPLADTCTSASHMALSALTAPPSPGGGASSVPNSAASLPIACAAARPQSLPGPEGLGGGAGGMGPASLASLTPDQQLREDFTVLAKDLVHTLKGVVATLVCERGRLRAAMDSPEGAGAGAGGGAVMAALRTNLTSALQQNSELRSRLSRIHDASDLAEISSINNTDPVGRPFPQSLSFSSSCVSASEFFDAEEHEPPADLMPADEPGVIELDGDSSSEAGSLSSGEEGSASSDNSDGALLSAEPPPSANDPSAPGWSRRTRLPCPRPTPGGPSLWNLLYKNIGKDLSQVSMPVTINEPLNMLQRLCEELEYSELLDAASECPNGLERMSLVAAFAVSTYAASAHRAASKPFNPLLAETYECVRGDKGFKFLAEQVSHHPPISACHAESARWVFWQEARIKTKFWGKSMEFQPAGRVHVRLRNSGDHYSWNKVTTCVHNLFGGQRWVDQYGDMHIVCHGTEIACKLNFIKASSWSSSRHEVRGWVTAGGSPRLRLQGRWSEALYAGEPPAARCLWRPGAMPPEHELYYGFTRFAMELNEMEPGLRELLPHTDTRLRPDQRSLEEGDVEAAEQYKLTLEQSQRDRRSNGTLHMPAWFRKAVEEGEEMWVFTGEYWKAREAGFSHLATPRIW